MLEVMKSRVNLHKHTGRGGHGGLQRLLRYELRSWAQLCDPRAGGGRLGGEGGVLLSHNTVGGAGGGARHCPRHQD